MRRYLKYLSYVIRHKAFVFQACWEEGLIWRGLKHDMSKLMPCEFIPYARFFYEPDGSHRQRRDKTGYYKPTDTGDQDFDKAWLHHQKWNDHHWQWWIVPQDDGGVHVLEMSNKAWREMICDWKGAGRAQGVKPPPDGRSEVLVWYEKNRDKMNLHPHTRALVESTIGYTPATVGA